MNWAFNFFFFNVYELLTSSRKSAPLVFSFFLFSVCFVVFVVCLLVYQIFYKDVGKVSSNGITVVHLPWEGVKFLSRTMLSTTQTMEDIEIYRNISNQTISTFTIIFYYLIWCWFYSIGSKSLPLIILSYLIMICFIDSYLDSC